MQLMVSQRPPGPRHGGGGGGDWRSYFADIAVLDAYLETVEADLKLLKIQK